MSYMILMKETIFFFVFKFWKISQKVVKRLFSLFREVKDFPPYLRFYFCGSSLKPSHDKTRGRCKIVNEVTCVSIWMDRETQVNLQSLCWRLYKPDTRSFPSSSVRCSRISTLFPSSSKESLSIISRVFSLFRPSPQSDEEGEIYTPQISNITGPSWIR